MRQRIKLPILCACVCVFGIFFALRVATSICSDKAFGRHPITATTIYAHLLFISIFPKSWSENSTRTIRKWKTIVFFPDNSIGWQRWGEKSECTLSALLLAGFFRFNSNNTLEIGIQIDKSNGSS